MNFSLFRMSVLALLLVALAGFGVHAVAQSDKPEEATKAAWDCPYGGYGGGKHGKGHGYGGHGAGFGKYRQDLSQEQIDKLAAERKAFRGATQDLRADIRSKMLALRSEMAKPSPDAAKASELQGELSELQGQFDQKRIAHMMAMKKIDPEAGMWQRGHGMGRGWGGKGCKGGCRW